VFPDNTTISEAAKQAYEEAQNLLFFVGVSPTDLSRQIFLPGIDSWMGSDDEDDESIKKEDTEELEGILDEEDIEELVRSSQHLFDFVDSKNEMSRLSPEKQSELKALSYAVISLSVNDSLNMCVTSFLILIHIPDLNKLSHSLPEPSIEEQIECLKQDSRNFQASLTPCLKQVDVNELTRPFDLGSSARLDFSLLVSLRHAHQTKHAEAAVRVRSASLQTEGQPEVPISESTPKTQRQMLLKRFNKIIREEQERRTGTGVERGERWKSDATGNLLNAQESAKRNANMVRSLFCFPRSD